jgi:hypothetical protein
MSQEFMIEGDHEEMVANWIAEHGGCERCAEFDEVHDSHCPNHPDYDPTPYCSGGHRTVKECDCGPIADND